MSIGRIALSLMFTIVGEAIRCGSQSEGQVQVRKSLSVAEAIVASYGQECRLEEREVLWSLRIVTALGKDDNHLIMVT